MVFLADDELEAVKASVKAYAKRDELIDAFKKHFKIMAPRIADRIQFPEHKQFIDQYIAERIDPSTIVDSISVDGDTYECVEALEQPALRWLRAGTGLPYDRIEPPPAQAIDPKVPRFSKTLATLLQL